MKFWGTIRTGEMGMAFIDACRSGQLTRREVIQVGMDEDFPLLFVQSCLDFLIS